jgi:hypothetical protein
MKNKKRTKKNYDGPKRRTASFGPALHPKWAVCSHLAACSRGCGRGNGGGGGSRAERREGGGVDGGGVVVVM